MDFESPDVEKDFPGLYASECAKKSQARDSDYTACSDEEKASRKKRERRESKKDKGYVAFEGESSGEEIDDARSSATSILGTKSPGKSKKNKSAFKFPGKDKKEKPGQSKERRDKDRTHKKEGKEIKYKDTDKAKDENKSTRKQERKLLKLNYKKKKNADQEVKDEKPIFGVPLQVAVERNRSHDGLELPIIVRECIDYIEEHGLSCEGIYTTSGLKSKLQKLKSQYNKGEKVYLYEYEPHVVASLLKHFLRDLPEPILTAELTPKFEDAAAIKSERKRIETLAFLLDDLPNCNRLLVSWILVHMLHVVNLERRNKMNLQNVSIVLSPIMQISHRVLHVLFAHSAILFRGVELEKYVPPIELDSSRLSLELPDSPSAIAEELSKQENVLNILHDELNTGLRDKQKEERLWEIQRVVTQLKRKLRFLRQIQNTSKCASEETGVNGKIVDNSDEFCINTVMQKTIAVKVAPVDNTSIEKTDKIPVESFINSPVLDKEPEEVATVEKCETVTPENLPNDVEEKVDLEEKIVDEKEDGDVTVSFEGDKPNDEAEYSAEEFVKKEDSDDEKLLKSLFEEQATLCIQGDELLLLSDELRRKVSSEKMEIGRLKLDIKELQGLYKYKQYSFDSTENSSTESDDSSVSDDDDEDGDCISTLDELIKRNSELEAKNFQLSQEVQRERETCLNIKVQMKMLHTEAKYIRL